MIIYAKNVINFLMHQTYVLNALMDISSSMESVLKAVQWAYGQIELILLARAN
jgi:hypothetical protein